MARISDSTWQDGVDDAVRGLPERTAGVRISLLGALRVDIDGRPVDVGSPKQRALCAILALHAGDIVPVDRIIELLWGDDRPRTAAHSVQIYVSGLRKALGRTGSDAVVETRGHGYRLAVVPSAVDVHEVRELVHAGDAALRRGEADMAVATLQQALDRWRGEPFADFAYAEFAQGAIRSLDDLRTDARHALAAAHLACAEPDAAARIAEQLVAVDEISERSVELLMLAQYRSGRHAHAMRSFRRHCEALADAGLVPSPGLARLHERILLHDPALAGPAAEGDGRPVELGAPRRNPYKGLRPFGEADAADYFGRDALVDELLERLAAGERLVSVVGPSGCGKSSAIAAGLLPKLRAGAIAGSQAWRIASFVPTHRPLEESESVLRRAAAAPRDAVAPASSDVRARVLGSVSAPDRMLLVIDQFEELFVATDDASADRYLDAVSDALDDAAGRLVVVLSLRADHYDRPLLHPRFADHFTRSVVNVVPMTPADLTAAITGPAAAVGLEIEPALVSQIVADTTDRPASLPLLQYALAEQVDRAVGATLTVEGYQALGGVAAALSRRADALFDSLPPDRQDVAALVLTRMVRVGHGTGNTCRQVPMAELTQLQLDPVALSEVIERFVGHRLLSVGSDPLTNAPTVAVAHESLFEEWDRLAGWIARSRTMLRRCDALRVAAAEWEDEGRDDEYLLSGARLVEVAEWATAAASPLTTGERAFVAASLARRAEIDAADAALRNAHLRLQRRAKRRLALVAVLVPMLVAAVTLAGVALSRAGAAEPSAALLFHDSGVVSELVEAGYDRAVSDFGLTSKRVVALAPNASVLLDELAAGHDAVVTFALETDVAAVARAHPRTTFVVVDQVQSGPNITSITFAANEGAYLGGAAAALASQTGTIGFIGGIDAEIIWEFEAGFAAGARAIDPDIRILTTYLGGPTDYDLGFMSPPGGERAARRMYEQGADVVFPAAGTSGIGAFEAAADLSTPQRHLWVIGVDDDQYASIANVPWAVDPERWKPHVLTSVEKRFDDAVYAALRALVEGETLPAHLELGLADGGVGLATSGGYLSPWQDRLDELREAIIAGDIDVPCLPADRAGVRTAGAGCGA